MHLQKTSLKQIMLSNFESYNTEWSPKQKYKSFFDRETK